MTAFILAVCLNAGVFESLPTNLDPGCSDRMSQCIDATGDQWRCLDREVRFRNRHKRRQRLCRIHLTKERRTIKNKLTLE